MSKKISKNDLIAEVSQVLGITKKACNEVVDALEEKILEALKSGNDVALAHLGTFKVKSKKARKGRNPQTGKEIQIPASNTVSFKPSKSTKDLLNKKK